jgi:hypothetical protein
MAADEEPCTKKAKSDETPAVKSTGTKTAAGAGEPTAAHRPEEPQTTDPAAAVATTGAAAVADGGKGHQMMSVANNDASDNKDHEQGSVGGGSTTNAALPTCLLCPLVLEEIHRLGGKWELPSSSSSSPVVAAAAEVQEESSFYEINGHQVPLPMGQFLFEIQGLTKTYKSCYESSGRSVWGLTMGSAFWLPEKDVPIANRNDRKLVCFGMADGGNYYMVLDLDDSDPTDPQVYNVDHDDPDQRLYNGVTLREFLGELEVET